MPWLRQKSVESFVRLNPDWKVDIVDGAWMGPHDGKFLSAVHRSDRTRYHELATNGGVYFDTDIAFIRPVPERLLTKDYLIPVNEAMRLTHIACLGAAPGASFFADMDQVAGGIISSGGVISYQQLGIWLLTKFRFNISSLDAVLMQGTDICPIGWYELQKCWNGCTEIFPDSCFGIHWSGNDLLTMEILPTLDEKWLEESSCLIARALRGEIK